VRFADVGTVIDSVENRCWSGKYNGKTGVTLGNQSSAGRQHHRGGRAIRGSDARLARAASASIDLGITLDRSTSIRNAVNDVQMTLLIAAVLVVGVIFLFLRTASATFIPSGGAPHHCHRHLSPGMAACVTAWTIFR